MTKTIVIVLAVVSATCELLTLWTAARELSDLSARRERVLTEDEPVLAAITRSPVGTSMLELERLRVAILDQWQPARRTTVIVKHVAPLGVLSGLAAAIVAVS